MYLPYKPVSDRMAWRFSPFAVVNDVTGAFVEPNDLNISKIKVQYYVRGIRGTVF